MRQWLLAVLGVVAGGRQQALAVLTMFLGVLILVRGVEHSLSRGLGWQSLLISVVLGGLFFALGLARWRYWRQR